MRILLIDDHALVRSGLRQLLQSALGAELEEAADAEAALAALPQFRPQLAILDIGLPGAGGLTLVPRLRQHNVPVLVLSMHTDPIYANRALEAGALGYASKNIPPDDLVEAVRQVAAGRHYIEPAIAHALAVANIHRDPKLDRLSPRDLEIMRLLAGGRSLSEIGQALEVSYKTVANNVSMIRAKLGVVRTADLIRLSLEWQFPPAA